MKLLTIILSVLCLAAPTPRAADTPAASRPNIPFIVGDDMGYADVGFHGCREIPTPNLDALAASGTSSIPPAMSNRSGVLAPAPATETATNPGCATPQECEPSRVK